MHMNDRGKELRVAFVGSVIPEEDCPGNPTCNVAGNKFQKNLVLSLRSAIGRAVGTFSYVPAIMFPRGRHVWYGRRLLTIAEGQIARTVPFINLPVVKQLTQAFSIFLSLLVWHWANRREERVVIVYNVFAPHALAVLLARAACGGKALAVVADLPHGLYEFAGFWGLLERLDMRVQVGSISRFDGQITLTRMIADDFAPHVPALIVEGGIDPADETEPGAAVNSETHVLLFSGTLNEVNGTRLMLDAFALLDDPTYRLRIFGRGPLADLVRAAAECDPRIEYLGFHPNSEIVRSQQRATVLLNPRPSAHAITRYTFPSKLMEYMLSGRPVITTRLAGITPDYHPHLFLLDDETPEGLTALIRKVCTMPANERDDFGRSARHFVLQNKSWIRQGQRISEFIRNLQENRR